MGNLPQPIAEVASDTPTEIPGHDRGSQPASSYGTPDPEVTIFDMAPTQGFIDYQKRKRLDALRPKPILSEVDTSESSYTVAPLLDSVLTQIPSCTEQVQTVGASLSTLDRGRISLREAMKRFGWSPETPLDYSCDGKSITIFAVEDGKANLSLSQSRLTLRLSLRRRLGLPDDGQVLVLSHTQPIPHIQVVSIAHIAAVLDSEGVKK